MLYLELFHGRRAPDEDMDDWGEQGPVFAVDGYVQSTYSSTINFRQPKRLENDRDTECTLWIVEGLVPYGGMLYGDYSVFSPAGELHGSLRERLIRFDPDKAVVPEALTSPNKPVTRSLLASLFEADRALEGFLASIYDSVLINEQKVMDAEAARASAAHAFAGDVVSPDDNIGLALLALARADTALADVDRAVSAGETPDLHLVRQARASARQPMFSHSGRTAMALQACKELVAAYERAQQSESIDWSEIDRIHHLAGLATGYDINPEG